MRISGIEPDIMILLYMFVYNIVTTYPLWLAFGLQFL